MRNCQHAQKWLTPPDLNEDLSGPEGRMWDGRETGIKDLNP